MERERTGVAELSAAHEKLEWLRTLSRSTLFGFSRERRLMEQAADAAEALRSGGIPCYLAMCQSPPPEETAFAEATHQWHVVVPGKFNLRTTSVLEEAIFNPDIESEWRAYLERLSDEELARGESATRLCGLFDGVERITRAYEEEMLRRGLSRE